MYKEMAYKQITAVLKEKKFKHISMQNCPHGLTYFKVSFKTPNRSRDYLSKLIVSIEASAIFLTLTVPLNNYGRPVILIIQSSIRVCGQFCWSLYFTCKQYHNQQN